MKHLAPNPQISESIRREENDMLDDERLAALTLGILAIPVVNVGKGSPGTSGHNDHGCNNTAPKEEVFQMIQYVDNRGILHVRIVKHSNCNNGRQPDAGGKIVNEAIQYNQGFLQHAISENGNKAVPGRDGIR